MFSNIKAHHYHFQNKAAPPGTRAARVMSARASLPRHACNVAGVALMSLYIGSYGTACAAGPAPVKLGKATFFTILSKSGITDVPGSAIVGNIGTSPITGAADHVTCSEVTGNILSVDAAGPAPCSIIMPSLLGNGVRAMQKAYNDAAGRTPTVFALGNGNIGGLTIPPGTYNWTTPVSIGSNVTLAGHKSDVWIFQVAQDMDITAGSAVKISGGGLASNVFWQVGGKVTMESSSHLEGIVLAKQQIALKTSASVHGRLYTQTAVTLQMNAITKSDH